jgi:mycofactocin precursor
MKMSDSLTTEAGPVDGLEPAQSDDTVVQDVPVEDVLVEEVSIDGMCGVY